MSADRAGRVAGVVLAAGTSSRLGRNKLLLPLEGEPVLRRSVTSAMRAGLDPVIVVLGFEPDKARATLEGLSYKEVLNEQYEKGINSSVRLAIANVPDDAAAAVVMLPDMPFVTSEMLQTLVERYRSSTAPVVVSLYGDVNAPPTLHDRSVFAEFFGQEVQGCGRHIVRRHRDELEEVAWPADALDDLDVPGDYESVTARLGAE
ncbi:MAG: NTP transferase domain-containing protein [Gemmatimonadales bacterium]